MNNLSWKWAVAVAVALSVAGCGDGGPRLYKAGGTVFYKDAPVEGATVTFSYADGNFANGVTGADGKFQLNYRGNPGGAALGSCKVSVAKVAGIQVTPVPTATTGKKTAEEYQKEKKAQMDSMMEFKKKKEAEDQTGGPKSLIPKKYGDANTSGLVYEIKADESQNKWDIKLTD